MRTFNMRFYVLLEDNPIVFFGNPSESFLYLRNLNKTGLVETMNELNVYYLNRLQLALILKYGLPIFLFFA